MRGEVLRKTEAIRDIEQGIYKDGLYLVYYTPVKYLLSLY
jgi:hypothetical protein